MEHQIDSELCIECLNLPIQVYNVLKRAQINTIPELLVHTSDELLKLKRFGPGCLCAVTNALAAINYPVINSATYSSQTMHQLYFVPRIIIARDGTKRVIQADTEVKLQLINNALQELLGTSYQGSYLDDHLSDAIDSINQVLAHFGDPSDSFGEPPVTLDEMHTAAWQQHQEMHS
jgi:hypothetical protein